MDRFDLDGRPLSRALARLFLAVLFAAGPAWGQRDVISTPDAPLAKGPFKYGDLLFIAGQVPIDPRTHQWVKGTIDEQTRRVLDNIKAVLAANDMTMANVLSTTVYLRDFGDFQKMNSVYSGYFGTAPPARATVPAPLAGDMLIKISAIAGR